MSDTYKIPKNRCEGTLKLPGLSLDGASVKYLRPSCTGGLLVVQMLENKSCYNRMDLLQVATYEFTENAKGE